MRDTTVQRAIVHFSVLPAQPITQFPKVVERTIIGGAAEIISGRGMIANFPICTQRRTAVLKFEVKLFLLVQLIDARLLIEEPSVDDLLRVIRGVSVFVLNDFVDHCVDFQIR